jgi:hypothetical protein
VQPPIDADQARWIVERGQNARALMGTPAFLSVVDDLSNLHLAALVATRPGATDLDAREYHHLLHHALTEIVSQLRQYDQAGEAMQRVLEEKSADGDDDLADHNEDTL